MTRTAPLVPLPVLVAIALVLIALLIITSTRWIRNRWTWLFPEIAAFTALAAIHLLFFWQPYRTAAVVPAGGGDLASYFYPLHVFAAGEIQGGRFPFWDAHLFSGMPHLANVQSGALYPPNMIAYLLADPFDYATLETLAIGHYMLASLGVYWLARAYRLNRPASVLAGAVFAYSGFLVAHLGHYSMLCTISWAGFIYAAIVGAMRRHSWPIALLGTLAIALSMLGGHPPILLMMLTLGLALTLFELWRWLDTAYPKDWINALRQRELWSSVGRLAFMPVIAFGLSLPFLAPAYELSQRSVRTGLDYGAASEFSVEPTVLIHLIVPTVFGSNPTDYWGAFTSTEIWGYAGVVALLLAGYGVAAQFGRTRIFWLLVAAAGVLYLLGPYTSLHGWTYAFVPGFDRIRAAGRAYFFVDIAVALLAAWGLQSLMIERRNWSDRQRTITRWGLIGLGVAFGIVVLWVIPLFTSRVLGENDPGNRPVIALDNVILLALWLLLSLGVGIAIWRQAVSGIVLVLLIIVIALVDLFHATAPFNPTTDDILAGYYHPESVAYLRERYEADSPFRIDVMTPAWQPNLAQVSDLDDIAGLVDPMQLANYERFLVAATANRDSSAYQALNARYLIGDAAQPPPSDLFVEVFRAADGIVIWEYKAPRPRAWIEGSDVEVEILDEHSGELVLSIPAANPGGMLRISQADYPGWSATIDGVEADVELFADGLQSVEIPAGAHIVELGFRPSHWGLWLVVATTSAVVWFIMFIYVVFQHRRRPQSSARA